MGFGFLHDRPKVVAQRLFGQTLLVRAFADRATSQQQRREFSFGICQFEGVPKCTVAQFKRRICVLHHKRQPRAMFFIGEF